VKKLLRIYSSSDKHWVGSGFPVSGIFDYNGLGRDLSPFLLLDFAAEHQFSPSNERRGVGEHPHRGFETVTVVYQGEVEHRDSGGGGGKIGPGDVQWMTAGSGVVHEEFHSREFAGKGGKLEMVQLWVNLRAKDKWTKPRYQTLLDSDIPNIALPQDAGNVRVIAGEYGGRKGPAKTFTPINLWDVRLNAGKQAKLLLPTGHTTAFLVLSGEITVYDKNEARSGDLGVFDRTGESIVVKARTDAKLLIMDGEPIAEPIVGQGPFVMNTVDEIHQAMADYKNGRMGQLANADVLPGEGHTKT